MSDLYTDADLDRAMRHAWGSDLVPESFAIYRTDMRDALDAVAPAIAARALREAHQAHLETFGRWLEIGRASCRERVCLVV